MSLLKVVCNKYAKIKKSNKAKKKKQKKRREKIGQEINFNKNWRLCFLHLELWHILTGYWKSITLFRKKCSVELFLLPTNNYDLPNEWLILDDNDMRKLPLGTTSSAW